MTKKSGFLRLLLPFKGLTHTTCENKGYSYIIKINHKIIDYQSLFLHLKWNLTLSDIETTFHIQIDLDRVEVVYNKQRKTVLI